MNNRLLTQLVNRAVMLYKEGKFEDYILINPKVISYSEEIERKFMLVLDTCEQLFGRFAFRRMPDKTKRRTISKALFETWTSILAKYSLDDLQLLVNI